ncbi:response regulator [Aliarcobacter butzleri]|uniref:response regulator n=1 Tax=Aliarcobacter butzleri TaxID=28197 RepID=UPI0021B63E5A|nr:response regulator [Aliarcobacter butzleri]MCT7606652.1 response regulator [Aliarcobacter butzleri]
MKNDSLKYKFLGLIIFLFLFSFIAFFYIFYDFQKQKVNILKDEQILKVDNSFNKNIEKHLKNYYLDIARKIFDSEDDYEIKLAIKENDRKKLEEIIAEKYDILVKKDKYITQMNFFSKDKINILRLQKLDLSGEKLRDNRPLLNDAFNTKKVVSGFENGLTGLSYRVIIPLFDNQNDFIGVFEIGISTKKLLDTVTFFNNIEGVFYNNYSKDFLTSKAIDSKFLEYLEKFKYEDKNQDIEFDNKHLNLQFFNIFSNDGKNLGNFIFFHDLTKYYDDFYHVVKSLILISLFTIFVIYLIVIYTFNIFYKQISIEKNRAEKILNSSNSIVIVSSNGKNLTQANQAFLKFFNLKSISEFTKKYNCICDHFIEEKNYLSSQIGELSWVEYISKNPNKTHFAKMKKDNKFHTFKVFIKNINDTIFDLNEIVVTFEDITQELENEELLKQSLKYNQALFDNTPVAIFLASSNRVILNLNNTACEIFGYTKEELLNQSFERIHFSKESFDKFSLEYKKFENSILTNFEFPFKHKNGNTIFCSLFGTPLDNSDLSKGFIWTLLDITEKKLTEKALIKERNLFSNGPVVVVEWKFDKNWPVKYISSNCETVLGYTKDEMLSEDFNYSSIIHKDDLQRVSKEVSFYTKDKNSYEQSYRIRLKNGEYRWFYDFNHVIKNSSGEIESIRGYMFDQTQLKESEIILQKMNEELKLQTDIAQKANEAKSKFLANMSHEIRTPLNGTIGLINLVLDTPLNPLQNDYLNKAIQTSNSLLNIINDILDYSKIEIGKLDILKEPFYLNQLLENISNIFGYKIYEKGLEFSFTVDPKINNSLIGDSLRLTQILNNFIGNAIKFTQKGYVHVDINLIRKNENKLLLDFSVKDTGIGIALENQNKLFKAFNQEDSSTTKRFGGTGLGLVIAKQLVELMDGEVYFSSIKDKGSTFGFKIELEYIKDTRFIKENLKTYVDSNFLIIDDSEIDRDYLKKVLSLWKIDSLSASNGLEAYEIITREKIDYIIVDWHMPELNGLELLKKLQDNNINIPNILMITAHNKQELLNEAQNSNIYIEKIIEKPFTPSTLYNTIFDKKIESKRVESEKMKLISSKKALVVEDNEINQLVTSKMLESIGFDIDIANDGLEAVDMVNKSHYDIVFMDLQMPNMDGFEATKRIREFNKKTPIVALSAAVMDKDKELTSLAGMNNHLAKPLIRSELESILKQYFEMESIDNKLNKSSTIFIKGINISSVIENYNTDINDIYRMYEKFYKEYKDIDKDLASLKNSEKEYFEYLHKLKGVSGNLHIQEVFETSKKIYDNKELSFTNHLIEITKNICENIESSILPILKSSQKDIKTLDLKELKNGIEKLIVDLKDYEYISSEKIGLLLDNLKTLLPKKDIDLLNKSFEKNDNETVISLLENILKDLNAK